MSDIIITLPDGPSERIDKALAAAAPEQAQLSRSRLARLIAAGAVLGPGGPVTDIRAKVSGGSFRVLLDDPAPALPQPQPIALNVVHEDDDIIVIDKPAGIVVHPAPGSADGTLVNALLHHCAGRLSGLGGADRPGIVHRIDKDTSGLLVAAKSDAAHQGLARQFAEHSIARRYLALAHGAIDGADARLRGLRGITVTPGNALHIATMLGRHPHDRQRQAVNFDQGRHAVTRTRLIESFGTPPSAMLAECELETGRTHQIRVHMAHAGFGLIGDPVYGGARRASLRALGGDAARAIADFPRQALHAAHLGFRHPVNGALLAFDSRLPEDMMALLQVLRG